MTRYEPDIHSLKPVDKGKGGQGKAPARKTNINIIIIFFTVLFFFLLIDKRKTLKRTVLILITIYGIYLLRIEHAAFCLGTYFSYYFIYTLKKLNFLKLSVIMILSIILMAGGITLQERLIRFIQMEIIEKKEFYTQLLLNSAIKNKGFTHLS